MKIVYAVVVNESNEFLLIRKGLYWKFPGGKVKKGEHVLIALRRIVKNQLASDTGSVEFLNTYENRWKHEKEYYYRVKLSSLSFQNKQSTRDLKYFSIENIPDGLTLEHKKRMMRFV